MPRKTVDLTGHRFGRLVVVERVYERVVLRVSLHVRWGIVSEFSRPLLNV